jgi:ATP-dependent Lon protease
LSCCNKSSVVKYNDKQSAVKNNNNNNNNNKNKEGKPLQNSNFNIIFTVDGGGRKGRHTEDDEDYTEDEEDYTEDDEDYTEDDDTDDDDSTDTYTSEVDTSEVDTSEVDTSANTSVETSPSSSPISSEEFSDAAAFTKFNAMIASLTPSELKNSVVKKMVEDMAKKERAYHKIQEKKQRKTKRKNTEKFRSLLREKNVMNDLRFFQDKMTVDEQQKVLVQMDEIKKFTEVVKPYRLSLLDADIPTAFKACAFRKITTLKYMEPGSGEYHKIKNWVDTFMQIPYGKYKSLPLTIDDGVEKCHEFMDGAKKILDEAVFGLNDAKLQIMQMVGQWITNPSAIGTAIAIKGPMGTGKTTLVKEGISKILGRDFAFIALGGATDSSFLEGHSYTYEGSSWGKIVEILIQCKCMNPVIYFDELDKVSDTPKGEEIIGILTHLTDTTQNSKFHDKYFAELDFDLSKCLFIFSYNDESKVNPILRDRMYRIHTKDYDQAQKTTIAKDYLLPKIREQVRFKTGDIIIPDETLHHIIEKHTEKESGVRNLKRCLEIIHTKLNLYRLMKPGTNLFESDMSIKVEFPMEVSPEIVDKLIKKAADSGAWTGMYS